MRDNGDALDLSCFDNTNPTPNASVVQCVLYNTSYQASFTLINGEQTVDITKAETPYNIVIPYSALEWDRNNAIFSNYFTNGTIIPNSWNNPLSRHYPTRR